MYFDDRKLAAVRAKATRIPTLADWTGSKAFKAPLVYRFNQGLELKSAGFEQGGVCSFMCMDWARRILSGKVTYGAKKYEEKAKRKILLAKLVDGQKIAQSSNYAAANLNADDEDRENNFNRLVFRWEKARVARREADGKTSHRATLFSLAFQGAVEMEFEDLFGDCKSELEKAQLFGVMATAPLRGADQNHVKIIRFIPAFGSNGPGHEIAVFFQMEEDVCVRLNIFDPNVGEATWLGKINQAGASISAEVNASEKQPQWAGAWMADLFAAMYMTGEYRSVEYRFVTLKSDEPTRPSLQGLFQ